MSDELSVTTQRAISIHKSALALATRNERDMLVTLFSNNDIPLLLSETHVHMPVHLALGLLESSFRMQVLSENYWAGLVKLLEALERERVAYVVLDTTSDGQLSDELLSAIEREQRFNADNP